MHPKRITRPIKIRKPNTEVKEYDVTFRNNFGKKITARFDSTNVLEAFEHLNVIRIEEIK
jgi:hypothetical protein